MFVSSMSSEELYAEAMKDFSILQTKIDLFMDRCGKRYRQEHFIGRFTKRMVVTTKRNNSWTIAFLALNESFSLTDILHCRAIDILLLLSILHILCRDTESVTLDIIIWKLVIIIHLSILA